MLGKIFSNRSGIPETQTDSKKDERVFGDVVNLTPEMVAAIMDANEKHLREAGRRANVG